MNNTDPRKTEDELKQAQITNKTLALLLTTAGKNEPNIVFNRKNTLSSMNPKPNLFYMTVVFINQSLEFRKRC